MAVKNTQRNTPTRGRPKNIVASIKCVKCEQELETTKTDTTSSIFFGRIPICKNCIESTFNYYCKKYEKEEHEIPEKDAIRRICMTLDIYYKESAYQAAVKNTKKQNISLIMSYLKVLRLSQYSGKNYDNTIADEKSLLFQEAEPEVVLEDVDDTEEIEITRDIIRFFGSGLPDDDYIFLQEQYLDWTSRHECNTKAQEEIFKQICFVQLELLKATRAGEETKDLTASFQKLLDSAKLQPKQNTTETTSDSQTFGTLIQKWENTRPIPEIDEDLRDVDKIGYLIHVFFTGHMAKVLNLKSSLTAIYDEYMKKYTVKKRVYEEEENDEALFNSIFGKKDVE